jgi:hypothetical protein
MEHFLKCLKLIFDEKNGNEFSDIFLNDYPYELDSEEAEEFFKAKNIKTPSSPHPLPTTASDHISIELKKNLKSSNIKKDIKRLNKSKNAKSCGNTNKSHHKNSKISNNQNSDDDDDEEENNNNTYTTGEETSDFDTSNNHNSSKNASLKTNGFCQLPLSEENSGRRRSNRTVTTRTSTRSYTSSKTKASLKLNKANSKLNSKKSSSKFNLKMKKKSDDNDGDEGDEELEEEEDVEDDEEEEDDSHAENGDDIESHDGDLDEDEDEEQSLSSDQNFDQDKILKINFSDRETRNRFLYYHKSTYKVNDGKSCQQWKIYNKKLLSKLKNSECSKSIDEQTLENDQTAHEEHSIKRRKFSTTEYAKFKREKKELNNFILTNFSTHNELDTLKRLFYGPFFNQSNTENKQARSISNSKPMTGNKKEISKEKTPSEDLNSEFIRRHQSKTARSEKRSLLSDEKQTTFKRRLYDDQSLSNEESTFRIVNRQKLELVNRCICLSTIFRNLSFVPGNDVELCKHTSLLKILAKLLVFKHSHKIVFFNDSDGDDDEFLDEEFECIKELKVKNLFYDNHEQDKDDESWLECVNLLRENTLVTIANIAGQLRLNYLDEDVIQLYAHGLIHWSICKSKEAQDTLLTISETSMLSPQRLAIETLSKMTIHEINVDLILVTISNMRPYLNMLVNILCSEWLVKRDDETLREFAIVLMTAMAKCDQFAARAISKYVSFLIGFIEEFEEQTRRITLTHPNLNTNNEGHSNINEEHLGTTIEMLRRCANCIMYVSLFNENISYIMKYEHRLLDLTTSQYVDYKVVQTLAQVLFYCSSSSSVNIVSRSSSNNLQCQSI